MAILDFYKAVLAGFDYEADKEGMVSMVRMDGQTKPAQVDGKRLVLPTQKLLKAGITDDVQAFHPLAESVARRGPSEMLAYMQLAMRTALASRLLLVTRSLLELAVDTQAHKDLPTECAGFLKHVSEAKPSVLKTWKSIESALTTKKYRNSLVTVYLKNGGSLAGEPYNRLCVIRFPIMEELEAKDGPIFGVKCTQKDRRVIRSLMTYILPLGDVPNEYSAGSNAQIAPYLDALLRAYQNVGETLNTVIARHNPQFEEEIRPLDLSYTNYLNQFKNYLNKIPVLPGNQGKTSRMEVAAEEVSEKPAEPPWEQESTPQQPAAPQAPTTRQAPSSTPPASAPQQKRTSLSDYMRSQQPQHPPQGGYPPAQAQNAPYNPYSAPMPPQGHMGNQGGFYRSAPVNPLGNTGPYNGYQYQQTQQPMDPFEQAYAFAQSSGHGGPQGGGGHGGRGGPQGGFGSNGLL